MELLQWFMNFWKYVKFVSGSGFKSKLILNQESAEEIHRPSIRKFEKQKVYFLFKDNILGSNLADIQLMNKFNKGICFLLCVNDIYSKSAWVVLLKDKKGIAIINAFQKVLDESNHKPSKI